MNYIFSVLFALLLVSCNKNDPSPKTNIVQNLGVKESVGNVVNLKGEVFINNNPASLGHILYQNDKITTKNKSFAKLEMKDQSSFNIGSNSEIVLQEYLLKNEETRKVLIDVILGTVKSHIREKVVGEGNYLKIKTPSVSFGVRGTEFITQVSKFIIDSGRQTKTSKI